MRPRGHRNGYGKPRTFTYRVAVPRELVYSWADGIYVKAGLEKQKAALLVVIGEMSDGRKEILTIVPGLLVVIDGGKGLYKSVMSVLKGHACVQRCQYHKRQNVVSYLPKERAVRHPSQNGGGLRQTNVRGGQGCPTCHIRVRHLPFRVYCSLQAERRARDDGYQQRQGRAGVGVCGGPGAERRALTLFLRLLQTGGRASTRTKCSSFIASPLSMPVLLK